jgi:hypothetical protein
MKHYLQPRILRRGDPVTLFIKKDGIDSFWLGAYHELRLRKDTSKPYRGEGREYHAASEMRITKAAYEALLAEAKYNYLRYKLIKDQ